MWRPEVLPHQQFQGLLVWSLQSGVLVGLISLVILWYTGNLLRDRGTSETTSMAGPAEKLFVSIFFHPRVDA
jgi:hypothetical protein